MSAGRFSVYQRALDLVVVISGHSLVVLWQIKYAYLLEVGQEAVPRPVGVAESRPARVVADGAAEEYHGVDGAAAADTLATDGKLGLVVQARLRYREQIGPQVWERIVGSRHQYRVLSVVKGPGLDNEHLDCENCISCQQPVRESANLPLADVA